MVNDGKINIKASKRPAFMYDEDESDDTKVKKGLCRGSFLVRVSTQSTLLLMYARSFPS
jgi:hypothetical protein